MQDQRRVLLLGYGKWSKSPIKTATCERIVDPKSISKIFRLEEFPLGSNQAETMMIVIDAQKLEKRVDERTNAFP